MKLVSFYCDVDGTDFYSKCAESLRMQCLRLRIPHLIVNENFGTKWIDNVRAKPAFLLKIINELNEDFFWLDVDCLIHQPIDFERRGDWMGDLREDGNPHDYFHLIRNSHRNKAFIQNWADEVALQKRGSHTAFIRIYNSIEFHSIPKAYVSLGRSPVESKFKYLNPNGLQI